MMYCDSQSHFIFSSFGNIKSDSSSIQTLFCETSTKQMDLKLDINQHDICRICMTNISQTNTLSNFFSNIVVDGYIISVPDMIMKCLDIESNPDDELPDKICDVCKKEITNFYLFREKSARTEQILLTAFNKPQRNKESSKPATTTIATQTVNENLFTCVDCKMIFKTENLLLKHFSHRHSSVKIDASCQTEEFHATLEDDGDGTIEEVPESIEIDYNREMKLEGGLKLEDGFVLEDVDEEEEMHIEMDDDFSELDHEIEIEIESKQQPTYQCICSSEFTKIDDWRNHKCQSKAIVQVVDQEFDSRECDELSKDYYEELILEDEYECVQCREKFTNMEEYTIHCYNNVHYYNCQQCNLSFNDHESFQAHNGDHHNEHNCSLCFKRFKTITTFNQHKKLHDSIELVIDQLDCFTCDDCHKVFLLKDKLLKHDCVTDKSCTDYQYLEHDSDNESNGTENKPVNPCVTFFCEVCLTEFKRLDEAKQHAITHSKQLSCPFEGCGCTYDIWSRFAMHLGTKHLMGRKHQCKFCELECHSFDALQAHYKTECPEKKFKCDHCDKSYFSQKALNLHIKDVTKGKTFACTFCQKSFNRRGELDLHLRSHTNERPYPCTICGKSYKTSSMRAAHMDAHIQGKTFPCTLCDKKLQTRTSYRNHMKRHTEEKKHVCEHCGKKFFTNFHLKLHVSKIHDKARLKAKDKEEIEFDNMDSLDDEQMVSTY